MLSKIAVLFFLIFICLRVCVCASSAENLCNSHVVLFSIKKKGLGVAVLCSYPPC